MSERGSSLRSVAFLDGTVGRAQRGLRRRFTMQPRDVVINRIERGSTGVEVGAWKGDFSARALRRARPAKLSLVDPWIAGSDPEVTGWYGSATQSEMDEIHEGVRRRFAKELQLGIVEILRMPSLEAAPAFADSSLDWVYIDGDHRHDGCLADLAAWLPKVKVGGLLCGDDYGSRGWWEDGVTTAVEEFTGSAPVRVEAIWQTQFVLRRLA